MSDRLIGFLVLAGGAVLATGLAAALGLGLQRRAARKQQSATAPSAPVADRAAQCASCGAELEWQRLTPGPVVDFSAMMQRLERAPYRCRGCGTVVCKRCAETKPCPKCSGGVFDVALT